MRRWLPRGKSCQFDVRSTPYLKIEDMMTVGSDWVESGEEQLILVYLPTYLPTYLPG
jgi:hypothetical protein